jgi:hypothetical protein
LGLGGGIMKQRNVFLTIDGMKDEGIEYGRLFKGDKITFRGKQLVVDRWLDDTLACVEYID